MFKEQRIFLKPEDDLEVVLHKLEKARAAQVILRIPADSVLRSSTDNFHAIKKEMIALDKDVIIESTDPYIEEMASLSRLKSINPIFGRGERLISDIIPRNRPLAEQKTSQSSEKKHPSLNENPFLAGFGKNESKKFSSMPGHQESASLGNVIKRQKRRLRLSPKKLSIISIAVLFLMSASFVVAQILPRATVVITLKKVPLEFEENIQIATDIYEVTVLNDYLALPGEVVFSERNIEMRFPASGEQQLEKKATGEVFIYNEFSSASQVLIATTRFLTPEGKIYRLAKRTIVPGAEVLDGKIIPSKIEVAVVANASGEGYNVNPDLDETWRIPGFKESGFSDRYEGFYVKPSGPMTGGFSGVARVPTDENLAEAEDVVMSSLLTALKNEISITKLPNLNFLDEAAEFEVLEKNVEENVDEKGQFSVFISARLQGFAFEEDSLKSALLDKLSSDLDFKVKIVESEIDYSEIEIDWEENKATLLARGSLVVESDVSMGGLRAQLLGQQEALVKLTIFDIPGMEKARVSLWPFWVKSVPENPNKVKVEFE